MPMGAIQVKDVPEELHEALARLKADGLRGLLLDLRWCPGGFLTQAAFLGPFFLVLAALGVWTWLRSDAATRVASASVSTVPTTA